MKVGKEQVYTMIINPGGFWVLNDSPNFNGALNRPVKRKEVKMNNEQKEIWIDRLFDIKQLNAMYKGRFEKEPMFKKYIT